MRRRVLAAVLIAGVLLLSTLFLFLTRNRSDEPAEGDRSLAASSRFSAAKEAEASSDRDAALEGDGEALAAEAPGVASPARPPVLSMRPRSKILLPEDAAPDEWQRAIEEHRGARNAIALQATIEARPGRDERERAMLLRSATMALASLGDQARLPFEDLLESGYRDVRLAALNAFVLAFPKERGPVITAWLDDPDPVIRKKAEALRAALR